MNVFAYWILLKSDQSCIWVLVVSILTLSTSFFRNFELLNWNCSESVVFFVFVLLFDRTQYWPWYCPERYCLRLYGLFGRILEKHYGMEICSLMEICCLLFIFLNVLLTLELLHFVLKVEWDYQYRKFEENVVCWHHHVCHISESLHNLYVYALRHVRISCIEIWSQWP